MAHYDLPTDEEIARLAPGFRMGTVVKAFALIALVVWLVGAAITAYRFFGPGASVSAETRLAELRKRLEASGFSDLEITLEDEGEGRYGFSGYRDAERCEGSARIAMTRSSSAYSSTQMCGVPETLAQAQRSCEGDRARSCQTLARELRTAEPARFEEAERAAVRGCAEDDSGSCFELGLVLNRPGRSPESASRAVAAYRKGCEGGEPGACNNLGLMLKRGDGTERADHVAACDAFERGCTLSNTYACTSFGDCFQSGLGRALDDDRAVSLYTQSCAAHHPLACGYLAELELVGRGTARDVEGAIATLQGLCDATPPLDSACLTLGFAYHSGGGPARDQTAALPLFARGCELGNGNACRNAAIYHREGLGGATRDPDAAHALFVRGCTLGDSYACRAANP